MTAKTYVSGTTASTATWSPAGAPGVGDDVTIGTGSSAINWDITAALNSYTQAVGYTGTVTTSVIFTCTNALTINAGTFIQGAYQVTVGSFTQSGGTVTGNTGSGVWWIDSGNWYYSAGTITADTLKLKLTGASNTVSASSGVIFAIHSLWVTGTYSCTYVDFYVEVANSIFRIDGSYALGLSAKLEVHNQVNTFTVNGSLALGSNSYGFEYAIDGTSPTISGDYSRITGAGGDAGSITFDTRAYASGPKTVTLGNDATFGCPLIFCSNHVTYTMTIDMAGHSLTATSITASTRGIISSSVAGAKLIAGSGGITVAANDQLDNTNISQITSSGPVDTHLGTLTEGKELWIFNGNNSTVTLAAGQKLYNVIVTALGGSLIFGANATIDRLFAHVNPIIKGAYTITKTKPDYEFTSIRRPLKKNITKIATLGQLSIADQWLLDLGAYL